MAGKKVVIVGGVAGGASTAARLRRLDEDAEIIMFERGPHISFANCGLPYHIGGVIKKRSKLLVQTAKGFSARFNIDVRPECEVVSIDRANHSVEAMPSGGKPYRESYDYLVLSPGAKPIVPDLPGVELPGILTLRDLRDLDRINALIKKRRPRKAVVVGGGYVGLEMAENLVRRRIKTAVVEMMGQVMPTLDPEMARPLLWELRDNGVAVWLSDAVARFGEGGGGGGATIDVELESSQVLSADMVILSVGVKPDVALARDADLEIGETGGIRVDEFMRTSDERIFAVGDAVEVTHAVTGTRTLAALAGPANRQGRIAADNIAGRASRYRGFAGSAIVKLFDLAVASTGANERLLESCSVPFRKVHLHPPDRPGYYPGGSPMAMKVLFSPDDGKLLGAQIVGRAGVDKRIDVLATAIRAGMTAFDLEDLELAYAPPYGSAKDGVNMAGFIMSNVLRGDLEVVCWDELSIPVGGDDVLLDVRSGAEWLLGHVPGALHIPVDRLRSRSEELPRDKRILSYCGVGYRSYLATRILVQRGFRAANVSGGWHTFNAARQDLDRRGRDKMFARFRRWFRKGNRQ